MELLTSLGLIHERINKELKHTLKSESITLSCGHFWLLAIVYEAGGLIKMNEIVKAMEKEKTTVSEMILKLERIGLLEKIQSEVDKRQVSIQTTAKADGMKEQVMTIISDLKEKMLRGISLSEVEVAERVLFQVAGNLCSKK